MPTTLEIGHLDSDAQMDWITASIEADTFSPHQNLPGAWSTAHAAECTLPADPGPSGGSPVADAGDDGSAAPGQAVILDASGSVGSGTGSVLAYHWEQIAGEVVELLGAESTFPIFEAAELGLLEFELTVTVSGVSDQDRVVIRVEERVPGNRPPVADAGSDQSVILPLLADLIGSASSDPDGDDLTHHWSILAQPLGSSASIADAGAENTTLSMDVRGTYVVQLVVTDAELSSTPDTLRLDALSNQLPVAVAGVGEEVLLPAVANLDGRASHDGDGDPLTYRWNVVEQPAGSSPSIADASSVATTLSMDQVGSYRVQLIVSDATGDSAPDSVSFVATTNHVPVADAGAD